MKELKFRQRVKGKWHYWGFIEPGSFTGPVNPFDPSYQYIGVKAKNVDIYEDDIVKFPNTLSNGRDHLEIIKLGWFEYDLGSHLRNNAVYACGYSSSIHPSKYEGDNYQGEDFPAEIIGNVQDNPELERLCL